MRFIAPLLLTLACGPSPRALDAEPVTVGCGTCQFKQTSFPGCYWAAEMDGRILPMVGDGLPADHDAHGPTGMCMLQRRALVTGTLERDRIVVRSMELLPADATVAPRGAHAHTH